MSKESNHSAAIKDESPKSNNQNLQEHTQKLQNEAIKDLSNASNKQLQEEQGRDRLIIDQTHDKPLFKHYVNKNVQKENAPDLKTQEIPETTYPSPAYIIQDKNGKTIQLEFPAELPAK